jgi:probable rRNA maturation factor
LDLSFTATTGKAHVPFMRRNLRQAWELLNPPLRELSIALVGDRRMGELHRRFMGIDGPTDVLTFPLDEDRRGRAISGEVVVCVPEARRQARRLGSRIEHELLLYGLHGMLHLCGFDDRTKGGFERMHQAEDDILTRIGVGITFHKNRESVRRRLTPDGAAPPQGGR